VRTQISVEDHVVLQLLSSAIEASELSRRAPALARSNKRIMTFGLLWGDASPARLVATVNTSALRYTDRVRPDFDFIAMKREEVFTAGDIGEPHLSWCIGG